MKTSTKIKTKFKEVYNKEPYMFRSPGRVNLIGEHTDYNMGFVLPAAIDKSIYLSITTRDDDQCKIHALDMDDYYECSLDNLEKSGKHWPDYLLGVVDQLNKGNHKIKGFNCVFGGDIPIGAGLSSSAALEAGLAYALNNIFNLGIDKLSLVKIAQGAENEFVGVRCGIMDQYINIFGKRGNVLRIDCRSLEKDYFPFDYKNISIVLIDTKVSHSLASSEYNQRRKECSSGVKTIQKAYPEIESLRDVSLDMLDEFKNIMDPVIYKRCKYVVEENVRLIKACDALSVHDLNKFGTLMYKTHDGLSRDYEVSCKELDYLVEILKDNENVYGSRMMGGGFGGCTINLIEKQSVETISREVKEKYMKKYGIEANIYVTQISGGTNIMAVETDVAV
jgi:galactokinase